MSSNLFRGLRFLFVPGPTVYKLNGIKAKAAEKHGATIAKSLDDGHITHVIVAKGATDLDKIRKNLRGSSAQVVDNSWPSDCIKDRKLLKVDHYLQEEPIDDKETDTSEPKVEPETNDVKGSIPKKRVHAEPPSPGSPETTAPPRKVLKAHRQTAMETPSTPPSPEEPLKWTKNGHLDVLEYLRRPPSPVYSADEGPNKDLIAVFEDLMTSRKATGQEFSGLAYQRALETLKSLRYPLKTYQQAIKLRGFGQKTAELVEEIRNGKAPQIDRKKMRDEAKILSLFETVYGVGPAKAREFLRKGYRTLKDISDNVDDKRMLVSIEHHEDLLERISRTEVEKHYDIVKDIIAKHDPKVECYCMGSFRRGQPDCGDIDIIITRDGASMKQMHNVMVEALNEMFKRGFAKFTFGGGAEDRTSTRWLGATALPEVKKWRRMDILCVPWQDLGAAMIYYTGNDIFNRRVRFIASRKGLRLTGNGLFKKVGENHTERIEGHDEKRIFEIIGVPWFEPHERIL